jgi:hypothetical protein
MCLQKNYIFILIMSNSKINNNIFYQKSKSKYNPDVNNKLVNTEKQRHENIFKKSNIVYNSITNQNPDCIKSEKDLTLGKDTPLPNVDNLISEKLKERIEQEKLIKMNITKQKIIVNETTNEKTNNYNEIKKEHLNFSKTQNKEIQNNKNKYEDIMKNLKDLGIIKY